MKQREVTDKENTRWTCVQAFTMTDENTSEKAAEVAENEDGKVTVVCTPAGGAKTVRLQLAETWKDEVNDEALLEAIENASR